MNQASEFLLQFLFGAVGAAARVLIGYEKKEPQSITKMALTVLVGSVLAGTSAQAITEYAGLPPGVVGGVSFWIGLLGIGFVYQVVEGKVRIPFLQKFVDDKGDAT